MANHRIILRHVRLTVLLLSILLILPSYLSAGDPPTIVKGTVTDEDGALSNVLVTDKDGSFRLTPHQDASFIYISTPAGFLPEEKMNVPQFFKRIEKDKKHRDDFFLKKSVRRRETSPSGTR